MAELRNAPVSVPVYLASLREPRSGETKRQRKTSVPTVLAQPVSGLGLVNRRLLSLTVSLHD